MYNLDRRGLFDCRVLAQQGRGGGDWKHHKMVFPFGNSPMGLWVFDWKASNRLIVQPQAHFPLLG